MAENPKALYMQVPTPIPSGAEELYVEMSHISIGIGHTLRIMARCSVDVSPQNCSLQIIREANWWSTFERNVIKRCCNSGLSLGCGTVVLSGACASEGLRAPEFLSVNFMLPN